ncbi:pentatricopeptide repeat-containing protein CRR2, chloroplastic-like [Aristolochia californica]|uniref:pentatricopeptide repeat-containing protein CRR2, chloroplastic-like n=1 Tax=Aristolochia californica TaxID=171875 RepID=UPI0035DEABB3
MIITQALRSNLFLQNSGCSDGGRKSNQKASSTSSREFGVLLQSCIKEKSFRNGVKLHNQILEAGFERNHDLLPKLIKFYATCGYVDEARNLFDKFPKRGLNVFMWTSMINGYIENKRTHQVFDFFREMLEVGVKPDSFTFSALLKASSSVGSPDLAMQLHSLVIKAGYSSSLSVMNSLIHVYGSLGDFDFAQQVFDGASSRDLVTWTSMIRTCSILKKYAESLELLSRMQQDEGLKPNEVTIVSVLPACGFFSSLRRGQALHAYIIRGELDLNLFVGSALVSMYSQCGDPEDAFRVFESMEERNVVLWTSMIEGFSMNGQFYSALKLFELMQEKGMKPNYITLVVILCACSHGGLVEDGWMIFKSMKEKFGIVPQVEHYACVADMLGRVGKLEEAEEFIKDMNIEPTASIYGSLLGACQVYSRVELGEKLASKLFNLEPDNAANYVILSNIYASVGKWDDVQRLRNLMVDKGLTKSPGCSWIEIKNKTHVFGAHDRSHPDSESIYRKLENLGDQIAKAGYVPSTKFVLLNVEETNKKRLLCSHSERLAIAYGLMKAPSGSPIRIAKNLRVCEDCHKAMKFISKVTCRKLVIRDTSRYHHFCEGSCSCGDYW